MLQVVLVIYYIVTVILTKELVIATDQCTEYQFKSPFFPGVSCEDIYNKNPESHERSGYYWIIDGPSRVYCGMNYTGSSCEDIYINNPETNNKSGYYRIISNHWRYCNMTAVTISGDYITRCAGVGGEWRRIANVNISAGDDCPGEWRKATQSNHSFCRVASDGENTCSSASFSTNGLSYQRVCGRARGYQKGATWAFVRSQYRTIDEAYVSGLSITYSSNPRQHIWSFASGYSESNGGRSNCPCADIPGQTPPSFVDDNYYCESAPLYTYYYFGTHYFNDTLWDGAGCIRGTCCNDTTQPWFYHHLSEIKQDDIEARICANGPFGTRSTLIDQLELYIQ